MIARQSRGQVEFPPAEEVERDLRKAIAQDCIEDVSCIEWLKYVRAEQEARDMLERLKHPRTQEPRRSPSGIPA